MLVVEEKDALMTFKSVATLIVIQSLSFANTVQQEIQEEFFRKDRVDPIKGVSVAGKYYRCFTKYL